MSELLEAARIYHADGIQLLPLPYGEKIPYKRESWKKRYANRPQIAAEIEEIFNPAKGQQNIGWLSGSISNNLVIMDFDSMKGFNALMKYQKFVRHYCQTTASRSGSGRGVHVAFRTPSPVKCGKIKRFDLDIKAEDGYCVEPPSLHRKSGGLYLFDNGYNGIRDLTQQDIEDFPFFKEAFKPVEIIQEPGKINGSDGSFFFQDLGQKYWNILKEAAPEGRRSEREAALIYRCVSLGWSFDHISALYARYADRKSKGITDHNWLWNEFRLVQRKCLSDQSKLTKQVNQAISLLLQGWNPYTGRTAQTDKAVTMAILQRMRAAGEGHFNRLQFSGRQIAEAVGISLDATQKSLNRMPINMIQMADGWGAAKYDCTPLIPFLGGVFSERGQYSDIPDDHGAMSHGEGKLILPSYYREDLAGSIDYLQHDAFRSWALGKINIFQILTAGKTGTIEFWMQEFNLKRWAMSSRLELLISAEVFKKDTEPRPNGRPALIFTCLRVPSKEDLDKMAEIAGTKGARAQQIELHERSRQTFRENVANTVAGSIDARKRLNRKKAG